MKFRFMISCMFVCGLLGSIQAQAVTQNHYKQQGANAMNAQEGYKFLEQNKTQAGVKTLDSGLQYKVITEGSGVQPSATDTVTVDYEGTLIDGTVFDSSYKRGQPISFALNQVIPGWTQGLQLMKEGATWMLYIPANLAYGDRPVGPIPANSTLIFKVHLIKVS